MSKDNCAELITELITMQRTTWYSSEMRKIFDEVCFELDKGSDWDETLLRVRKKNKEFMDTPLDQQTIPW